MPLTAADILASGGLVKAAAAHLEAAEHAIEVRCERQSNLPRIGGGALERCLLSLLPPTAAPHPCPPCITGHACGDAWPIHLPPPSSSLWHRARCPTWASPAHPCPPCFTGHACGNAWPIHLCPPSPAAQGALSNLGLAGPSAAFTEHALGATALEEAQVPLMLRAAAAGQRTQLALLQAKFSQARMAVLTFLAQVMLWAYVCKEWRKRVG